MSEISIIYKYGLFDNVGHGSSVTLFSMPENAQILSCQFQNGVIVIWALHDEGKTRERHFACYGTGLHIPYNDTRQHIATLQDKHGLVWHIFEEN